MPHELFGPNRPPPAGPTETRAPNAMEVRFLQQLFGIQEEVGYGRLTKEAVAELQRRHDIPVDDQVLIGPRTWQVALDAWEAQTSTLAAAVSNENAAVPVTAPFTNLPGARSPATYARVIDQFRVEENPRYKVRDLNRDGYDDTFCNIFMWDVTCAMGAEIPHWVEGRELNANAAVAWLANDGAKRGWKSATAVQAQQYANQGCPAVAVWLNPTGGPGHVAMVRPGVPDPVEGPVIAQAGATNFNNGTVARGFGHRLLPVVLYYIHE